MAPENPCQQRADERARANYEAFKATLLAAWGSVHGEKAREVLEEAEGSVMDLWVGLPVDYADATAVLRRRGIHVPTPLVARRVRRVKRFVAALAELRVEAGLSA